MLRDVVDAGLAEGSFTCSDPDVTVVRLAALMDGLAVQVALHDPDVPEARMTTLWLEAAASELGIAPSALITTRRPSPSVRATEL